MIRVVPAMEPPWFDERVRQPGLASIDRLAARAGSESAIPPDQFAPYWRRALDDLLASYNRICAYLSLHISKGVGSPSVDHMVAKSKAWDLVYEWSNYRLACSLMNARKGVADVLDPFKVEDGWFALELVEFQVVPGAGLPSDLCARVVDTIATLRLSDGICCEARAEYARLYWKGEVTLSYVQRRAPFVAKELQRQGRLRSVGARSRRG